MVRHRDSLYYHDTLRSQLALSYLCTVPTVGENPTVVHWYEIWTGDVETFRHEYVDILPVLAVLPPLLECRPLLARLLSREDKMDSLDLYHRMVTRPHPYPYMVLGKRPTFATVRREPEYAATYPSEHLEYRRD